MTTSIGSLLAAVTLTLSAAWLNLPGFYAFCLVLGVGYVVVVASLGMVGGGDADHDIDHDVDHDFDTDFDADADLDADFDADADVDGGGIADFDHDLDHDAAPTGHHGSLSGAHLGWLSPLIVAFFLTCFGGTGLLFTRVVDLGVLSVAPAAASSLVFAAAAIWTFNRIFGKLEASSHATASDLVGRSAKVIVPIPQGRGAGKIAYSVKGSRYTMTARSEDAIAMAQGAEAVILRIVGQCCFVAPPNDKRAREAIKRRARADAALN